jgi:hypothetical protein
MKNKSISRTRLLIGRRRDAERSGRPPPGQQGTKAIGIRYSGSFFTVLVNRLFKKKLAYMIYSYISNYINIAFKLFIL